MKNLRSLKGIKTLTKEDQKLVNGGYMGQADPNQGPGGTCPWNMCLNSHGRCSVFACPENWTPGGSN